MTKQSIHESGHVICAFALNANPWLAASGDMGRGAGGVCFFHRPADDLDHAVIALAGAIATHLAGFEPDETDHTDREDVAALLPTKSLVEIAANRAIGIVMRQWPAVERVAAALDRERVLDRAKLQALLTRRCEVIIRKAPSDRGPHVPGHEPRPWAKPGPGLW